MKYSLMKYRLLVITATLVGLSGCGEVAKQGDAGIPDQGPAGKDGRPPDTRPPDKKKTPLDGKLADKAADKAVDKAADKAAPQEGGADQGVDTKATKCGNSAIDVGEKCDGLNLAGWTCQAKGFDGGALKCKTDCKDFDTSGCHKCGDATINAGEKCDGKNLAGWDCKALGFDGGSLTCKADCKDFDSSGCEKCGDAKKNGAEQCDGTDLGGGSCVKLGFFGGKLACDAACKLVKTGCHNCGNAKLDSAEECDGAALGGKSCKGLGYDQGALTCDASCKLDKSGCAYNSCGNGKLEPPKEECEGKDLGGKTCNSAGYDGGTLTCSACKLNTSGCFKCGDGSINSGEVCDGKNLGAMTCQAQNFDGGQLACAKDCKSLDTSACYKCGDAKKNGAEQCDGSDLGGKSCDKVGFFTGKLTCKKDCLLDTSACTNCGNTKVDSGEECDGSALGGKSCSSLGYDKGTLKCSSKCAFDKSGCSLFKCGDGKLEGKEDCDGSNLGGKSCTTLGYDGGALKCAACKFDAAACYKCGDAKKNGSESCDGKDLAGKSCTSFSGFHSGTLACKSDCKGFVTSGCNKCGDAKKNGTEKCDGADLGGLSCSKLGFDGGTLSCSSSCLLDTSKCHKCGDGKKNGSEKCDGSALGGASCLSLGKFGGTLGCTSTCEYDYLDCTSVTMTGCNMPISNTNSVGVDSAGNAYIAGAFYNSTSCGSFSFSSKGGSDISVAKLDPSGKVLWATTGGGYSSDVIADLAVDASGNSYILGKFTTAALFGTFALTTKNSGPVFLAKLDSSGKYLWAQSLPGYLDAVYGGLALDASGNVFVTAKFGGTQSFGSTTLTAKGDSIFVAKLNSSGKALWAAAGTDTGDVAGIAVDGSGNSFITGNYHNDYQSTKQPRFGSLVLPLAKNRDIYVAKLDASGTFSWATVAGSDSNDDSEAITTDSAGNIWIGGAFGTKATFGTLTLSTTGSNTVPFVARLDSAGKYQMAIKMSNFPVARTLAPDGAGGIVYLGATTSGNGESHVAKISSNGITSWSTKAKGWLYPTSQGRGLTLDSAGRVLVTGHFNSKATIYFGGTPLVSTINDAVWLWRMGKDGP